MRVVIAPSLMAFAATAAGLLVTSPAKGDKVDVSEPVTIKWQAVNTDPSSFSIYLVNQNVYPNTQELIAANVDSDKGSYNMKAMENIDKGGGYQINFVSDSDNGILAQSQQFKVTEPQASMSETTTATTKSTTTNTRTMTTTTDSMTSTSTSTATGSASTTTNAAASLVAPVQAGSLLMGLFALAL